MLFESYLHLQNFVLPNKRVLNYRLRLSRATALHHLQLNPSKPSMDRCVSFNSRSHASGRSIIRSLRVVLGTIDFGPVSFA